MAKVALDLSSPLKRIPGLPTACYPTNVAEVYKRVTDLYRFQTDLYRFQTDLCRKWVIFDATWEKLRALDGQTAEGPGRLWMGSHDNCLPKFTATDRRTFGLTHL